MDALNPSKIQRIVLLVDLHPILALRNTDPYLSNVIAAARRILSFPALSTSLVAYKFFFSSLSPIVSTSKLRDIFGKSPTFMCFDRPIQTLESLLRTINSLSSIHDSIKFVRSSCSRASFVAGSLLQLEHDYAWELHASQRTGMLQSLVVRSNLVVLFSPIPQSLSCLSEYLSEGLLLSFQPFLNKFLQIFGLVKERLVSRDIHVSWVYVSCDGLGDDEWLGFSHFQSAMKKLGWGCYRTAAIILGSALVPFGLIFPYIGYTMDFNISLDHYRKDYAELILRIIDSNGATLDCTMCDLGVIVLKLQGEKLNIPCLNPDNCGKGGMRICIREVREITCITNAIENSCALILLHGIAGTFRTEASQTTEGEFITKSVLKLLCDELGGLDVGKPIWQIVLTFLYNKNCSALVSISGDNGSLVYGILQPFTLNYALVSIFPKNIDIPLSAEMFSYDSRKGNKTNKNLLHGVSWSSFIERVFSQLDDFDSANFLEKLYFNLPCGRLKKLRFLKCWLKQIKGINISPDSEENEVDNFSSVKGVIEENSSLQQKSECDFSTDGHCSSQPAGHLVSPFFSIDDSNAFLGSISQKIDQALHSKEVDLFILVERLVLASIDALSTKCGRSSVQEFNQSKENDSFDTKIATELSNLLLVKPKDLELKCKFSASTSSTTEHAPVIYSNEEKISLHELQILFRMEILRSKAALGFNDSAKRKLIRDICLLLQNIEFYLHGDFFGGESLLDYATKIIKCRYEHSLPDVIKEIYNKMEFFSFDEHNVEASESVPANNDDGLKLCENLNMNDVNIANVNADSTVNQQDLDTEIEQQLNEAQERRNRARRFSSFTSWVPDLQRVWAPRHPMSEKPVHEIPPKVKAKKRKRQRSSIYDRVCETP